VTYYRCTLWKFRSPIPALLTWSKMKQVGKPTVLDLDLKHGGNVEIRRAIRALMPGDFWGTGEESVAYFRLSVEDPDTGEVVSDLAATTDDSALSYFSADELWAELQQRPVMRDRYEQQQDA
jgi:hypothetical protein